MQVFTVYNEHSIINYWVLWIIVFIGLYKLFVNKELKI